MTTLNYTFVTRRKALEIVLLTDYYYLPPSHKSLLQHTVTVLQLPQKLFLRLRLARLFFPGGGLALTLTAIARQGPRSKPESQLELTPESINVTGQFPFFKFLRHEVIHLERPQQK